MTRVPNPQPSQKELRHQREKAALKANMARRKAQMRARGAEDQVGEETKGQGDAPEQEAGDGFNPG